MKKVVFAAMMALSCTFAFAGTNPVQSEVLPMVQSSTQVTSDVNTNNTVNESDDRYCASGGGSYCCANSFADARLLWMVDQCLNFGNHGACERV